MIDVVIISDGKSQYLRRMTERAVESCRLDRMVRKVFVVEEQENVHYPETTTLHQAGDFNYNRRLNFGFKYTGAPYVGFFNNDVEFGKDWARIILEAMQLHGFRSASPCSDNVHLEFLKQGFYGGGEMPEIVEGWNVRSILAGWAICMMRNVYYEIGGFDESVEFWHSDNLYAKQIESLGIRHALIRDSKVTHLESKTLMTSENVGELTGGQLKKFEEAVKKYNQK